MIRLFGGLLLGVGLSIMTCSGLCSLVVVTTAFTGLQNQPYILLYPLFIGGIPFAIAFGMFKLGQEMLRASDEDG
ncbi:hypothetical protein [Sphingomonas hengshuiensis]|uniref:hypothetical protein n=1 Tax=Sphingomonas hengshuiensis TaxID=1609977 RepID=UPI000B245C71|nr:hypothetical protein [Sphingomonas hengshuiensis]